MPYAWQTQIPQHARHLPTFLPFPVNIMQLTHGTLLLELTRGWEQGTAELALAWVPLVIPSMASIVWRWIRHRPCGASMALLRAHVFYTYQHLFCKVIVSTLALPGLNPPLWHMACYGADEATTLGYIASQYILCDLLSLLPASQTSLRYGRHLQKDGPSSTSNMPTSLADNPLPPPLGACIRARDLLKKRLLWGAIGLKSFWFFC